jgi:ribosomal-protein-alanine N-acetyltransferase
VSVRVVLRPSRVEDAAGIARLYASQRSFLAPYEPARSDAFFTEAGQRRQLQRERELRAAGAVERFLIVADGVDVGVLSVSNILRGPLQSAVIGYFVAREHNGRGVATRAVGLVVEWAFEEAGLHRLEAGTLVDNHASQRVLERNGFERIGLARRYLHVAGEWRDHILFQRTADDPSPAGTAANSGEDHPRRA